MAFVAVPAMAQDNFPDVPENHWAYEALENLKREGILVGYPDGTYKGPRAATRYEMAVALNAAYQRLKNITDGLAEQIAELRRNSGGNVDGGLADRLAAVEAQLRGMSGLADDMAAMKRMAGEFQKELASLGVDVEQMKKDIDAMKKMGVVEPSIRISGDANLVMHAGVGEDSYPIYGIDGRWLGYDSDRGETTNSILGDMNVYHEIAMNIDGNPSGGVKWGATLVYTNLLGTYELQPNRLGVFEAQGYGNLSGHFVGSTFEEGPADMYISRLQVDLSDTLPFHAVVGRFGVKSANPYLFQRPDNSPYFENGRWDDGKYIMDGIQLGWEFGQGSSLSVTGGRNDDRMSVNGIELNPLNILPYGGPFDAIPMVQSSILTELRFGIGERGGVALTYNYHGLNWLGESYLSGFGEDRLIVYGAALDYQLTDNVALRGGWAEADLADEDNNAYWAGLSYAGDSFGVDVSYRSIDSAFIAPGAWQRIGTFYNPRGIADFTASANFALGSGKSLTLEGIFGEGQDGGPDYWSAKADLSMGFGGGWTGIVGLEQFSVDYGSDDLRQRWYMLGASKAVGRDGLFKLLYQYGDHTTSPFGYIATRGREENYRGHMLFSQVTVKF
ncbi:MAG: S-layer homology domain-containing protein [Chthonomonas sp.]|nr:S-layer homology domain-containing protein [Chthonomonas sp.]